MRGSVNADTEVQTRTGRVRKSFGGRQNSSWAAPKAMRGKCERGHESANADGAGTEVFAGDGCSQGRLSTPWLRFHGVDRADVYIIIRVRACCCGECALNPPTSQPIPRRRPSLAPHSDTPFPSTSAPPRSPDARPQAARCIPRRPHNPFPAQRHAASPSVPLRAQKNGTAQCMCDAECLGRPSLRSVIWVGEPRAVRRRCGALACRRGA